MIDRFPHFSKLALAQQGQIQQLTRQFPPYSDFNFTSMFSWDTDGSAEVSWLHDNLVMRMPDYLDGHQVYSMLGSNAIDTSLHALFSLTDTLALVPEVVVEAMTEKSMYRIEEDEDNFDYVYDLAHLVELPGTDFKKKRHKRNSFVRDHEDLELVVRVHRAVSEEHAEAIRVVDRNWAAMSSREDGDILSERKALDNLLRNFSSFSLILTEVYVEGELKAFSINEVLNQGFAICHFEKALKSHHEHINTFLVAETAKHLSDAGCRWVNWEQDLGLEGLRRSKRSYNPVNMLKKFVITKV